VAIPLGKNNDEYTSHKSEYGPPAWNEFFHPGMGVGLVDGNKIKNDQECQNAVAAIDCSLESISEKIDEFY
jgi:hypothetical protein